MKTRGPKLRTQIFFCSLRSWVCTEGGTHQPSPLQNWDSIHELPFWSETNHEILVTYFRTCTLAWGLSCPVAFVSICWLICCLLALFLSSRIRLLQFLLRYIWIETGQHYDLLLKQICYLWFSNVPVVYKLLHLFCFFFQYRKCVFPGQEFNITFFFSTQFSLLLLLCAVLITFHVCLSFSFVSWSQFSVILVTQAPYDFADGTFRQTLKP